MALKNGSLTNTFCIRPSSVLQFASSSPPNLKILFIPQFLVMRIFYEIIMNNHPLPNKCIIQVGRASTQARMSINDGV